jgi:transposase InsO family protein
LTCCTRRPFPPKVAAKPIKSSGFLHRIQIDLISYTHAPDGEYRYVLHMRDHFTRFSWTRPLFTKRAAEVATALFDIFCMFGPPCILQSDNGKEFTASLVKEVINLWPDITIINGRPRHPQSQGLVERGNQILENRISKWMEDNQSSTWATALPILCRK